MVLKLYNTLTRTKEVFAPLDPENVRMYVCGPTVYDFAHIGNARPVIVFDVLFRLLRHLYGESHVTYVRNITDVDDKINARALRDYPGLPLNDAIRAVTQKTADQFQADAKALGCLVPTQEPRATENIQGMVDIIGKLLENGYAYIAAGPEGREVLFDTGKMKDYGQLSRRPLNEQRAGARVAVEAHKKNPGDFVLWKESSPNEPGWHGTFKADREFRSNTGNVTIFGRPGWHIECSAMSKRYLGEVFDIHGGGLDLIFPHHENEIAQSRCAFGTDAMASVWMHNGFLQVEGQKMSKSLGNFYTINDLMETERFGGQYWRGDVLRMAMLMTHYRQPIDFSFARLREAEAKLARYHDIALGAVGGGDKRHRVTNSLLDDLNTPEAIHFIDKIYGDALDGKNWAIGEISNFLKLAGFYDVKWEGDKKSSDREHSYLQQNEGLIDSLVETRRAARAAKNWSESDRIRDELAGMGIAIEDYKDGTTSWEVKR